MPATESLAARAETLLNRLAQVEAQEADQQARMDVERARARASRSRVALEDSLGLIPVLAEHGVTLSRGPGTGVPDLVKAKAALRSTATAIVGAPVSDVASRTRSPSVNSALETAEKLAKSLLADLNRSVDRMRQKILPEGIEQAIVVYPGASDALAVKLRRIQSRLQLKVDGLSASLLEQRFREMIADAASWAADRPRLDSSLEGQHPEVREFLRQAVTEKGAPWHLITPEVRTWLSDSENTVNLSVVLRS